MSPEQQRSLENAIAHLRRSERGLKALRNIDHFMTDGGISLDTRGKSAIAEIMLRFWDGYACDIHERIGDLNPVDAH
jgi:hypothetical protein